MPVKRSATPKHARSRAVAREPQPVYEGLPSFWRVTATPLRSSPLLVDTHVWLWTLDGTAGALGTAARAAITRAATERRLYVSDFSFWEVAMLTAKGRLELATDVGAWLERAALAPGIEVLPVSRSVLVESTRLPGEPHGDPADRILLAHAGSIGASLVTCDRGIVDYAKRTPGVPVCDARG